MRSKKLALIASTILCAICMIFGIVACGGGSAGDAIKAYIFPQAETLVSEDFSLPKRIGENNSVSVKWKSSNTNAIAIEDGGEQYTAKVTLQDEVTEVTLTISSGSASKDFIVRVGKLDVYTFMQRYSFPQRNTAVSEDFDLDTSVTVQGKTATIAWSVDPDYADFIALDGTKVVVTPGDELTAVKIKATFTYGEEEASMSYPFNVVPALSHRQSVNKMYSIDGYPLTLSGYIVNVLETSASYGNATLFMIDDDFCSGYYLYRIKIDKDNIDKYVEGAHITVSNDTAKNFNGLWENNGGGTATVDDQEPINPREKIYAFDTDLLSGVPSMIWHESTLVSLSGWKVKSVETAPDAVDDQTNTYMFTVERGDVSIPVRFSKYVGRTDAERADLLAMWKSIEVDTYVDITGLLGNYNGYQIQPVLASDITKVNAEGTNTDGAKVKAAVDAVNAKVKTNFSGLITSDQSFPMPTSEQGVTITYTVMGKKDGATVSYENGTLTVNPVATNKNTEVEVTYTIGDYTAYGFFTVRNYKASATELLADAKANVEAVGPLETKVAGNVTILPADVDLLGAEISWAIADAPAWASVSGNTVTITELPAKATALTLTATLTLGTETTTATITLNVAAKPAATFQALEAPVAGDYIFALYQGNLEKWLYSAGTVNESNFGFTTENYEEAAQYTLTASGDGWTIQLKSDGKYLELNSSHRMEFVDASTQTWKWDTTNKVFTFDVNNVTYYLGTYNDFNTISASPVSYLSGSSNFVGHFGNMSGTGSTTPSGEKGTESNPYTVAEILELAQDLADGSYYQVNGANAKVYVKGYVTNVGTIFKTYGLSSVMIADEKGGTTQLKLYTINWGDAMPAPNPIPADSPLTVGDYVVCYGFVKNFQGTIEVDKDGTNYPTFTTWTKVGGGEEPAPGPGGEEEPEHDDEKYGSETEPLTVEEALALAEEECTGSGSFTQQVVYMTGIVKANPTDKGNYYQNLTLVDLTDSTKEILVYTINLSDGVAAPVQHDIVVICGYIKNHEGTTIEFASNSGTYVYLVKNTRGESTITIGEHEGATVSELPQNNKATNGAEVTFKVVPEQGKKIVSVKVYGETLTATDENTYKFTVNGDATIEVETAGESEAVAELLYSLNSDEQPIGKNNAYDKSGDVEYENVTWAVEGNAAVDANTQKPWRFGGKNSNCTDKDRALTGKTAIPGKVEKITLQLTDGGSITVNSVTLKVYKTDPTAEGATPISTKEITYQKGVAVDITAGTDDWTDCFYQIVFNLTVSASGNKYVSIDKLEFYGTPASATVSAPAEVAVLPGKQF